MYPLLVNAVAATATNLIDRWAQSHAAKEAKPAVAFQQMLDGAASAKPSAAAMIESLRSALLASPEIRTVLGSCDPAHLPTLQLSPDGTVSAQTPGQPAKVIAVSPETAALARSLATMLPANATL